MLCYSIRMKRKFDNIIMKITMIAIIRTFVYITYTQPEFGHFPENNK